MSVSGIGSGSGSGFSATASSSEHVGSKRLEKPTDIGPDAPPAKKGKTEDPSGATASSSASASASASTEESVQSRVESAAAKHFVAPEMATASASGNGSVLSASASASSSAGSKRLEKPTDIGPDAPPAKKGKTEDSSGATASSSTTAKYFAPPERSTASGSGSAGSKRPRIDSSSSATASSSASVTASASTEESVQSLEDAEAAAELQRFHEYRLSIEERARPCVDKDAVQREEVRLFFLDYPGGIDSFAYAVHVHALCILLSIAAEHESHEFDIDRSPEGRVDVFVNQTADECHALFQQIFSNTTSANDLTAHFSTCSSLNALPELVFPYIRNTISGQGVACKVTLDDDDYAALETQIHTARVRSHWTPAIIEAGLTQEVTPLSKEVYASECLKQMKAKYSDAYYRATFHVLKSFRTMQGELSHIPIYRSSEYQPLATIDSILPPELLDIVVLYAFDPFSSLRYPKLVETIQNAVREGLAELASDPVLLIDDRAIDTRSPAFLDRCQRVNTLYFQRASLAYLNHWGQVGVGNDNERDKIAFFGGEGADKADTTIDEHYSPNDLAVARAMFLTNPELPLDHLRWTLVEQNIKRVNRRVDRFNYRQSNAPPLDGSWTPVEKFLRLALEQQERRRSLRLPGYSYSDWRAEVRSRLEPVEWKVWRQARAELEASERASQSAAST